MAEKISEGIGELLYSVADALRPDPPYLVSEWADLHRVLSSVASAEPGPWRTSRTPYLREIMDSLSAYSEVEEVAVMKGAQIGMSEAGLNFMGYTIHHAPGPALYVMPTIDMAKRISKQRLDPMIDASGVLSERIAPARSRDSGNSMFVKEYDGGVLVLTGANAPAGLRSMPMRYLVLDEVDGYPPSAGEEGDPVTLAKQRAQTFARRKVFVLSTPKLKVTSRIGRAFREGDQRFFQVACDGCGVMQPIIWAAIKWTDRDPESARFVCQHCGHEHEEHRKGHLLTNGEWKATSEAERPGLRSYHISTLYSPWKTWAECVREFLACFDPNGRPMPETLQVFVNTVLGEEWEDQGEEVDAHALQKRAEDWKTHVVDGREVHIAPNGVLLITCGVDVQGDRLEIERVGWGLSDESWSLEYEVIPGDPSAPEVWDDLDEYLMQPTTAEDGRLISVAAAAVDYGGHHGQAVADFVRDKARRRVWGIKGAAGAGRPLWPKKATHGKWLKNLYVIGVDAGKDLVYGRLRIGEPGPGYCHFPKTREPHYFEQMTSETVVTKYVKGFPHREWVLKPGMRNEALDLRVYALAALRSMSINWGKVQRILAARARPVDIETPVAAPPAAEEHLPPIGKPPQRPKPRSRFRPVVRSSFLR